jgi:hypothetical protein
LSSVRATLRECPDRALASGAPPDDLYIEPERWPRIGRPPKHAVEAWTVTDDWPIEPGVADLDDPALKERVASLMAIRHQAQADAARAAAMLETSGQQAITPHMVQAFARKTREQIRIDGGGYRRDHLRALAQRVEVADRDIRIIGSKSNLLQMLTAAAGVKPATPGVRSSVGPS